MMATTSFPVCVGIFCCACTTVGSESCVFRQSRSPIKIFVDSIAAQFGLSQTKLLTLNGARESTKILIGDRLCLRTRESEPTVVQAQQNIQTHTGKEVVAIIREIWPDEFEELALMVARRESNLKPNVVGGSKGCCIGLFQIYFSVHSEWLAKIGVTESSQLLDPRVNTETAYKMFKRNGESWKPWWTKSWRP